MIFALLFTLSFAVKTDDIQMTRKCIVDCAKKQIGKPYLAGGKGPDSFDDVGLVTYCYSQCEVPFSGSPTVATLKEDGIEVAQNELTTADLVFPTADHVQLYSGSSKVIHAPKAGSNVAEEALSSFSTARRIVYGDGTEGGNGGNGGGDAPSSGTCTVVTSQLNVRASPSTSAEIVAYYSYGEQIVYDSIVDGDSRKWLSYIGGSGNRRYVCGRDSDGTCYVSPCPGA